MIRTTQTLQNYGEDPNMYTARASFMDVVEGTRRTRGVVLDIDRQETIAKVICGPRCGKMCQTSHATIAFFHVINLVGMTCSILALNDFMPMSVSVCIALLWLFGPIYLILNANAKIFRRQMRYSGQPWFQLYLSLLQTYAIMDLFDYNMARLLLVVPPLITSVISLTISDAVYILQEERASARIDVLLSLIWQVILAVGVRYGLFNGMITRGLITTSTDVQGKDVLFQNSSMFCGKAASIIVMLLSQIIFRFRHPEQAFSLRAHYSILSNAEWAKKEARHRMYRRETLEKDVRLTRRVLSPHVHKLRAETEEEF